MVVRLAFQHRLPLRKLGLEVARNRIQPRHDRAEQFLQHGGMNGLRRILDQFQAHRLAAEQIIVHEVRGNDEHRADFVGVDLAQGVLALHENRFEIFAALVLIRRSAQKIGQQRFILVHHGEPDAAQRAVVGMSAEHHADERGHRQRHDEIDEPRQRVAPGAAQVFGEQDAKHGYSHSPDEASRRSAASLRGADSRYL